jgi:hypothetical protein
MSQARSRREGAPALGRSEFELEEQAKVLRKRRAGSGRGLLLQSLKFRPAAPVSLDRRFQCATPGQASRLALSLLQDGLLVSDVGLHVLYPSRQIGRDPRLSNRQRELMGWTAPLPASRCHRRRWGRASEGAVRDDCHNRPGSGEECLSAACGSTVDAEGRVVLRRRLRRSEVVRLFAGAEVPESILPARPAKPTAARA